MERLENVNDIISISNMPYHRIHMPTARSELALAAANNKIYAIGGYDGINRIAVFSKI